MWRTKETKVKNDQITDQQLQNLMIELARKHGFYPEDRQRIEIKVAPNFKTYSASTSDKVSEMVTESIKNNGKGECPYSQSFSQLVLIRNPHTNMCFLVPKVGTVEN